MIVVKTAAVPSTVAVAMDENKLRLRWIGQNIERAYYNCALCNGIRAARN